MYYRIESLPTRTRELLIEINNNLDNKITLLYQNDCAYGGFNLHCFDQKFNEILLCAVNEEFAEREDERILFIDYDEIETVRMTEDNQLIKRLLEITLNQIQTCSSFAKRLKERSIEMSKKDINDFHYRNYQDYLYWERKRKEQEEQARRERERKRREAEEQAKRRQHRTKQQSYNNNNNSNNQKKAKSNSKMTLDEAFRELDIASPIRDIDLIKKQYKKLMLKHHPDISKDDGEKAKMINLAYELASDYAS